MYKLLKLQKNDDYFKKISERGNTGVYFCRYIGFDDDINIFYRKYHMLAQNNGLYIKRPLSNPTESEVKYFFDAIGNSNFTPDRAYVADAINKWTKSLPPNSRRLFQEAVMEMLLEQSKGGSNPNILKNSFVKYMCWGRYVFEGVLSKLGSDIPPKILYEGDISKYELYMLHILSLSGCDVLYVNFISEDTYLKTDRASQYSFSVYAKRRGEPPVHFSKIDISAVEKEKEIKNNRQAVENIVVTNTFINTQFPDYYKQCIIDDIVKSMAQRGAPTNTVYNMFLRITGIDEKNVYLNRLFKLKKSISSHKKLVFIENRIENPSIDEVKKIRPISYTNKSDIALKLALQITSTNEKVLDAIIQSAFLDIVEKIKEPVLSKLYNKAIKFVSWLNRYIPQIFNVFDVENIPVIIYYGKCSQSEAEFLCMLCETPVDIIVICPDTYAIDTAFAKVGEIDKSIEIKLPNSCDIMPFPKSEVKISMATAAYNAERELDTLLYTGTGLFRNRQFVRSKAVTLKTTFDEIAILWKQDSKYRTGFEADDERVLVPNIFAKICGVKDGDINAYIRMIEGMMTENTILIDTVPFIKPDEQNDFKSISYKFIKDGQILPDVIKSSKYYKFDYLSDDAQDYILEKIQEMIELKWIKSDKMDINLSIISTILNINKQTIQYIQSFDFTKEIPKLIVVDVDEKMLSIEDCIYILFLNIVGFDIAVFTPTGYRNIEKYISREAFEEHQIGEYVFNLVLPRLRTARTPSEGSLLNRLFGRGRN